MSMTLKEYSRLFVQFVNRTFVPLLASHQPDHDRAGQNWKTLIRALEDIDKMDHWGIENAFHKSYMNEVKEPEYRKYEGSGIASSNFSSFYETTKEPPMAFSMEDSYKPPKRSLLERASSYSKEEVEQGVGNIGRQLAGSNASLGINGLINPSLISTGSDQGDSEGLEKLIGSFRKLANNFEANHKKMLREQNQNQKENGRKVVPIY